MEAAVTLNNYMLDANIFSNLVEGKLRLNDLPSDGQFWATPVQLEELKNAKDSVVKAELLSRFKAMIIDQGTQVPAAFAFDVAGAGFDEGILRSDGRLWHELKEELDTEWEKKLRKKKKNSKKENNLKDASIAEAAKFNDFVLVTCDCSLAAVSEKHGIKALLLNPRKV
jgi:predicted nucleic acid-binding protein